MDPAASSFSRVSPLWSGCLGGVREWAERIGRKYERGECSLAAQTDRITRGHQREGRARLSCRCPASKQVGNIPN